MNLDHESLDSIFFEGKWDPRPAERNQSTLGDGSEDKDLICLRFRRMCCEFAPDTSIFEMQHPGTQAKECSVIAQSTRYLRQDTVLHGPSTRHNVAPVDRKPKFPAVHERAFLMGSYPRVFVPLCSKESIPKRMHIWRLARLDHLPAPFGPVQRWRRRTWSSYYGGGEVGLRPFLLVVSPKARAREVARLTLTHSIHDCRNFHQSTKRQFIHIRKVQKHQSTLAQIDATRRPDGTTSTTCM